MKMTDKTTRRDVLKAAGTASAMSGFALTATASESQRIRVVEAGIRFDVPPNDDYDGVHIDSRPPYTVNSKERKFVLLNNASPSTTSQIRDSTSLFDERTVDSGDEVSVGPQDGTLSALPTELSSRMRVMRAVGLVSPIRAPTVMIHQNANAPVLNVESEGVVELPVGERTEVRLDPVAAEARTTHVVGKVSIEGTPEFMEGLKREQDSVEIEATPVVEAINHGELVLERQSSATKQEKSS